MAMLFAATYPERTGALALYDTFACTMRSEELPWASDPGVRELGVDRLVESWGTGERMRAFAPSIADDPEKLAWFGKLERLAMSPGMVRPIMRLIGQWDVRAVLPSIQVPTLVLHRHDDPVIDPRHAEYLAARKDSSPWLWVTHTSNLPTERLGEKAVRDIWVRLAKRARVVMRSSRPLRLARPNGTPLAVRPSLTSKRASAGTS